MRRSLPPSGAAGEICVRAHPDEPSSDQETQQITRLPFLVQVNQIALNKLMEIFAYENVCGVTGNTINDNYRDILTLKNLCKENGILVETLEAALQWEDLRRIRKAWCLSSHRITAPAKY